MMKKAMVKEIKEAMKWYYENTLDVNAGSDMGELVIEEESEAVDKELDEITEKYGIELSIKVWEYLWKKAKYWVQIYG